MLAYQKRVSFDSINPNKECLPDDPPFVPPQYATLEPGAKTKMGLDLNFGYETSSKSTDVQRVFDSFNEIGGAGTSTKYNSSNDSYRRKSRRVPKLPPAPKRSILKNNNDGSGPVTLVQLSTNANRKKSIVDMTAEELLALDQQYRKGVDLTNLKFDGDGYLPFQEFDSFESKKIGKQIQKIDKMNTSLVKQKNSLNDMNFSSYSTGYKHHDFKKYVDSQDAPLKSNGKDSLRDVMVYISGRKHTWDAINWSFKNYLTDGDQLIIVCRIPRAKPVPGVAEFHEVYDSEDEEELEDIKEKAERLKEYVFKVIELLELKDLKISLSIEFVKDYSVKNLLRQVIQFYEPHVLVASSLLTNLNFKISRKYYKLPVYVMKNLNTPVITIPDLLIDESSVSLLKQQSNVPNILIEDTDEIKDENSLLKDLLEFSDTIDPNKDYEPVEFVSTDSRSYNSRSQPVLKASSFNTSSESSASKRSVVSNYDSNQEPTGYFPENYKLGQPSIKFSDDLKVPRSTSSNISSRSPSASRRGSTNNGIYKVKSLLDEEVTEKPKTLGLSKTLSNELAGRRRSSGGSSIKKVASAPPEKEKEKKSFFGLFKKKSKA